MRTPPCRVLVIDNDPDILALMETLLREEGHRVTTAATAAAARNLLATQRPDVVISDLSLWSLHIPEALLRLHREVIALGVPVLVCTAWPQRVVEEATLLHAAGAHFAVLAKPFDVDELLAIVARLCRRNPDAEPLLGD